MNLIEIEEWLQSHGYTEKRGRWVNTRKNGITFSYVINTSSLRLDSRIEKEPWERVTSKQFSSLHVDEHGRLMGFVDEVCETLDKIRGKE